MTSKRELEKRAAELLEGEGEEMDRVDLWRAFLAGEITMDEYRERAMANDE